MDRRPIAIGEVILRTAAIVSKAKVLEQALAYFGDIQRAFQKDGAESIAHEVRAARRAGMTAISMDITNAFNSLLRRFVRRAMMKIDWTNPVKAYSISATRKPALCYYGYKDNCISSFPSQEQDRATSMAHSSSASGFMICS